MSPNHAPQQGGVVVVLNKQNDTHIDQPPPPGRKKSRHQQKEEAKKGEEGIGLDWINHMMGGRKASKQKSKKQKRILHGGFPGGRPPQY